LNQKELQPNPFIESANAVFELAQKVQWLTSQLEESKMRISALEQEKDSFDQLHKILSSNEVVDFAGCSLRTIYRAIDAKELYGEKGVDRIWRFHQQDVEYWMKKRNPIRRKSIAG